MTAVLAAVFLLLDAVPTCGDHLFFDDFDGPPLNSSYQPNLPIAPNRRAGGDVSYVGAPTYTFETVDGATVLHLQSILDDRQRAGWSTSATFPTSAPVVLEARFNTMVQSATTGIDELLEIWLLDANNPGHYDIVSLLTPGYGSERDFSALSSTAGSGRDTEFLFSNNTWYRMVLSGGPTTTVRASIYADDGITELIGVDLAHTLVDLGSDFRIGVSQSMGVPRAPYPTNSAVDYLSLTTSAAVPEPTSLVLLALGAASLCALRIRRRPHGGQG